MTSLSNIKAVFELKPLTTETSDDVPEEAAEASSMAMNVVQTFYSMVESKRNESEYSISLA
jgi:hypothetical protein